MPLSGTPEGHLPTCSVRRCTEANLKNNGWLNPEEAAKSERELVGYIGSIPVYTDPTITTGGIYFTKGTDAPIGLAVTSCLWCGQQKQRGIQHLPSGQYICVDCVEQYNRGVKAERELQELRQRMLIESSAALHASTTEIASLRGLVGRMNTALVKCDSYLSLLRHRCQNQIAWGTPGLPHDTNEVDEVIGKARAVEIGHMTNPPCNYMNRKGLQYI